MAECDVIRTDVDALVVDDPSLGGSQKITQNVKEVEKGKRKYLKRKRALIDGSGGGPQDKETLIARCHQEVEELFDYFKDTLVPRLDVEDLSSCTNESLIACLMEGSSLSLHKLAEEIYARTRTREGITVETLLRDLPFFGSRVKYGIDNGNLNLGEDESESCLWCWEAREMSLLPKSRRGVLKCLRMARKKVHSRVAALSATTTMLSKPECQEMSDFLTAFKRLEEEMGITEICSFVERSLQKRTMNMAEKEAKLKEKEMLKGIERNNQNAEKEQKRKEHELQKEKARTEKELKRLKDEAEKEAKRREKEEAEHKKQLKRQQDEADREQKRREKEEVELKRKLSMQKQASMMERFLKTKITNHSEDQGMKSLKGGTILQPSETNAGIISSIALSMDMAFSPQDGPVTEELRKSHLTVWHKLRGFNKSQHWGVRHRPKTEVTKELKLHGSSLPSLSEKATVSDKGNECLKNLSVTCVSLDKETDELEVLGDDLPHNIDTGIASTGTLMPNPTRKLLQFDKSHRPAYYGSWSKRSGVIGPRHPLAKDPDLDYVVDSDEEWEEEEPGESLTDCDKDDEEEIEDPKADLEDDSEDSFFVPDGYLSENEGVQTDVIDDKAQSTSSYMPEGEDEEFKSLLQLHKHLCSLTEKALRKSQPLIISNLMHEKADLLTAEDLSGMPKIEKIFLQALCMQAYPGGSVVELPTDDPLDTDEAISQSQRASGTSHGEVSGAIPDSDLPEFVISIQSHSHGISKVIESLQKKYPTVSKTSIKNKVREIADFVDNQWQVKTEILKRLGLPRTPDKTRRSKGIATFFSKRCLPPTGEIINVSDSSPVQRQKTASISVDNSHDHQENIS